MRHADLYVVQLGLRESRPCGDCMTVIKHVGIRRIFYSCNGDHAFARVQVEHVTTNTVADRTYHANNAAQPINRRFRF
jgi:tRNA(Arg) A34 adenosine deaminase TadA